MALTMLDHDGAVPVAALVQDARSGDQNAFHFLVRRFESQVLRTAWRLLGNLEDARDASQEVFLRFYKYIGRFDESRPLSPWLYRMTVNVCRDLARKRAKHGLTSLEDERKEPVADTPSPADSVENRQLVAEGLKTLTEKERTAVVLRDIEGLSTREVARVLGSTEITVRSHISRARLKMKRFLEEKQP
jgi:RNA polymerase sigma-70 factor (ECF subfamily)